MTKASIAKSSSKPSLGTITLFYEDDWTAAYGPDGGILDQGHSINEQALLEALGYEIKSAKRKNGNDLFPEQLADVK